MQGCDHGGRDSSSGEALPIVRGEAQHVAPSGHPSLLRIVDWNIKSARDSSVMAIASTLRMLDADVITLQEVDMHTQRTGGIDEPASLARALDYSYAFAATVPWEGGYYGIATLSRYRLTSVERVHLSNADASEPRAALDALVCPGATCIHAINHHADLVPHAAELSTTEVLQHIHAEHGARVALLGDLNQIPSDAGPRACLEAGLVDLGAEFGGAPTAGDLRIDYAFADAALAPCVERLAVMDAGAESDHRLLAFDLDMSCMEAPH
jgi:endonuclease/exonuclease/phosphatase family metal-dependent hydrolase